MKKGHSHCHFASLSHLEALTRMQMLTIMSRQTTDSHLTGSKQRSGQGHETLGYSKGVGGVLQKNWDQIFLQDASYTPNW